VSEFSRVAPPHAGALVFALTALIAAPASAKTLAVGQDPQCPRAQFTSIQSAVDNARPGDTVNVCPGTYAEQVTVAKPLTLRAAGDPTAGACLTRSPADPSEKAIIDPGDTGFTVALRLAADGIRVRGLVIQGASVGIDASDRFSGYRVEHNLIEDNSLFGIDFGSSGGRASRVDHNCLRDNGFGVVSELDDDSLWRLAGGGPEREAWNARDLADARIDHNTTSGHRAFGVASALYIAGPGRRRHVIIDHNLSNGDIGAVGLQNASDSAIVENAVVHASGNPIVVGGGSDRIRVAGNSVHNFGTVAAGIGGAVLFTDGFVDHFRTPDHDVVIADNDIADGYLGVDIKEGMLAGSLISGNTVARVFGNGIWLRAGDNGNVVRDNDSHDNNSSGILLNPGASGNLMTRNVADYNAIGGITMTNGATGNIIEGNSMHANGWRVSSPLPKGDARNLNPLLDGALQNTWTGNDCDTDVPAGVICGR
jgi:hypothetical protein